MFSFLRARREKSLQLEREQRELFLSSLTAITQHFAAGAKAQAEALSELAHATQAQADAMKSHLALLHCSELPISRVIRDEDEALAELARSGYPIEADPEVQLHWVLSQSESN